MQEKLEQMVSFTFLHSQGVLSFSFYPYILLCPKIIVSSMCLDELAGGGYCKSYFRSFLSFSTQSLSIFFFPVLIKREQVREGHFHLREGYVAFVGN